MPHLLKKIKNHATTTNKIFFHIFLDATEEQRLLAHHLTINNRKKYLNLV